jgi:hypothetical protein
VTAAGSLATVTQGRQTCRVRKGGVMTNIWYVREGSEGLFYLERGNDREGPYPKAEAYAEAKQRNHADPTLTVMQPDGQRVTYEQWSDGMMVGYRVTREDGAVEFIYFNPSDNYDGFDDPNVFVYIGPYGDPAMDFPAMHFVQRFETRKEES